MIIKTGSKVYLDQRLDGGNEIHFNNGLKPGKFTILGRKGLRSH